jgi:hypothetical protein
MGQMRTVVLFGASVLGLAACSEFNLQSKPQPEVVPDPDIRVDPPTLTYGTLATSEEEIQTFTIENVGAADLHVSDVIVASGISFSVLTDPREVVLAPGDVTTVDVAFTPLGSGQNFGQVLVLSDDPDTPEAPVDLLGTGAVPELKITPDSHQFGETFIPCGDSVELTMENVGDEDLVITDWTYVSGGQLTLDDSAARPQLPITLSPGELTSVFVDFEAATEGSDTGMLEVVSNDPRGVLTADQNGEGAWSELVTEAFTEPGIPPVDVMFLIDQSCSMSEDNQDDITVGIPPFVAELQNVADWQLIQITESDGCANGGIIDASVPNADQLLVDNAFGGIFDTGGFLTEALLELAERALSKTGPGQCNDGFLRPGALLHIIVASDEEEQSGHSGAHWVGEYQNYVSAAALVKVSSIVDLNRACGDNSGPGGYLEASNLTGGSTLNICSPTWGNQLTDIASEVLAGIRTYNLSQAAEESTIEVSINGTVTTDWDYTASSHSVTINDPPVGEGDLVEISYSPLAVCE